MKPCAKFRIDGELLQAPEERFMASSGKSVWEIVVQVAGYNGKSPNLYRVRVNDGRDVRGMGRGQRVRVEGWLSSSTGDKHIFYDLYADSVLPFAGEPSRMQQQGGYRREMEAANRDYGFCLREGGMPC